MTAQLLEAYTPRVATWPSVEALSSAVGLANFTSVTALEFFTKHGVSETWAKEMIEAGTRVNYAQDITAINGLGGAVSMAANGASQVKGGVSRIALSSMSFGVLILLPQNFQVCDPSRQACMKASD